MKTTEPLDGWSGLKCGPGIPHAVRSKVSYAIAVVGKKWQMLGNMIQGSSFISVWMGYRLGDLGLVCSRGGDFSYCCYS